MNAPGTEYPDGAASSTEAKGEGRTTQVSWGPGCTGPSRQRRLLALLFDPTPDTEPPRVEGTRGGTTNEENNCTNRAPGRAIDR